MNHPVFTRAAGPGALLQEYAAAAVTGDPGNCLFGAKVC